MLSVAKNSLHTAEWGISGIMEMKRNRAAVVYWRNYLLEVLPNGGTTYWKYYLMEVLSAGSTTYWSTIYWRYYLLEVLPIGGTICWKYYVLEYYLLEILPTGSTTYWRYYLKEVLLTGSTADWRYYLLEVLLRQLPWGLLQGRRVSGKKSKPRTSQCEALVLAPRPRSSVKYYEGLLTGTTTECTGNNKQLFVRAGR